MAAGQSHRRNLEAEYGEVQIVAHAARLWSGGKAAGI
jgi:hypothetical protein